MINSNCAARNDDEFTMKTYRHVGDSFLKHIGVPKPTRPFPSNCTIARDIVMVANNLAPVDVLSLSYFLNSENSWAIVTPHAAVMVTSKLLVSTGTDAH